MTEKPTDKRTILIVDDDLDLSMLIQDMLEDNGYASLYAASIDEAYEVLTNNKCDLILLDINLPDGTGFSLCKELRHTSQVPIIFASARTSEDDKVNGLDMGGDDYIAKPYSLKELMSRIRSILRRTYGVDDNKSEVLTLNTDGNEIEINRHARTVSRNKSNVDMKPKEFDLLVYMAENRGRVLTKAQIMSAVWGLYSDVEPSTVAVHVRWLREKLETDPSHPQLIRTVWGTGYVLGDSESTFSKKQYNKNADRVHVRHNHSFWLAVLQGEAGRDTADKR